MGFTKEIGQPELLKEKGKKQTTMALKTRIPYSYIHNCKNTFVCER